MTEEQMQLPMELPRWKHDCRGTCCKYLDTVEINCAIHDIYYSAPEKILILRYGDDGPDYTTKGIRHVLHT